ncbi:uncharacterized protein LOC129225920 [Uloborus diversus]|uniref:uncharacterized protein LOC129225920 n=1 Tax=Uloborus diversus TaxID=327109 RepID=UPI002409168F|nr:uncharacterized protein LOC129225920 [Uloborus diversus]
MLSALAKYIFGGIMDNAQEESMQCETREVNDWLLINMPDQAVDDTDFDSADEKSPESEDELEAIPDDQENEEDDILTSLPLLLGQDNHVCDTICIQSVALKRSLDMATRVAVQSILIEECSENFQVIPESSYVNHSLYYPSDYCLVMALKQLFRDRVIKSRKVIAELEQLNHNLNQVLTRKAPLTNSSQTIAQPIVIPQLPKTNALAPKEALLVQIKQLKPSQKAMQRDTRKLNSRSYLNRQNKNYIYESSVKTNRRSNLQRHHSGANNNRKCC